MGTSANNKIEVLTFGFLPRAIFRKYDNKDLNEFLESSKKYFALKEALDNAIGPEPNINKYRTDYENDMDYIIDSGRFTSKFKSKFENRTEILRDLTHHRSIAFEYSFEFDKHIQNTFETKKELQKTMNPAYVSFWFFVSFLHHTFSEIKIQHINERAPNSGRIILKNKDSVFPPLGIDFQSELILSTKNVSGHYSPYPSNENLESEIAKSFSTNLSFARNFLNLFRFPTLDIYTSNPSVIKKRTYNYFKRDNISNETYILDSSDIGKFFKERFS